jgi:DNA-binding MarR family transcriptional regulator
MAQVSSPSHPVEVVGRELRAAFPLDLDSRYLSRLLRALEEAGLVMVTASGGDRRTRVAREGRGERGDQACRP